MGSSAALVVGNCLCGQQIWCACTRSQASCQRLSLSLTVCPSSRSCTAVLWNEQTEATPLQTQVKCSRIGVSNLNASNLNAEALFHMGLSAELLCI